MPNVTPLLSVIMITYNHENHISKAIESVLNQKTNFKYEIVVGEDFSTDKTRAILLKYAQENAGQFKLLLHDKNIGAMSNHILTLQECKGKYIAALEGDDYWTDEYKLQKQVDYLEQHKDVSLVGHNFYSLHFETKEEINHPVLEKKPLTFSFRGLIADNGIMTLTSVFRNYEGFFETYKKHFSTSPMGDLPLFYMLAEKGNIAKLPDIMACHVVHQGGVYSMIGHKKQLEKYKKTVDLINSYSGNKHAYLFKISIINFHYKIYYSTGKTPKKYISLFNQALRLIYWRLRYFKEPSIYFSLKDVLYFLLKYKPPTN